jgi:hypothetical protein
MRYSSRFWLYAPLALFLALAVAAMANWWILAKDLDRRLTAMNGHQAVPGVTVSWKSKTIAGFPFRLDVVFEGLQVRAGAPRGPIIWNSEHFALHALTYGRTQDIFEAAGQQSLAWTDAGNLRHRIAFLPATLRASVISGTKGVSRFDLDILDAGGKTADGAPFTLARAQLHLRKDPKTDALDFMISGLEANTPQTVFGNHARKLEIYGRITEGAAFARLLAGQSGLMDALMAWKHRGGKIITDKAEIDSTAMAVKAPGPELEPGLRALLFPLY